MLPSTIVCENCCSVRDSKYMFKECYCKSAPIYSENKANAIYDELKTFFSISNNYGLSYYDCYQIFLIIDKMSETTLKIFKSFENKSLICNIEFCVETIGQMSVSAYLAKCNKNMQVYNELHYISPKRALLINYDMCIYCDGIYHCLSADGIICQHHQRILQEAKKCAGIYLPRPLVLICLNYMIQEYEAIEGMFT